jgi:hypothetical protein
MAVDDSRDLTGILRGGVVVRMQHKQLLGLRRKVAARPVAGAAFDHHNQPARLTGVFSLRMF